MTGLLPLQTEDPLTDEARLNRLRLLLTWTTAPNGLFQFYDVKHKTHIHRVGLTGPSLLKDHIATLFPPSVNTRSSVVKDARLHGAIVLDP